MRLLDLGRCTTSCIVVGICLALKGVEVGEIHADSAPWNTTHRIASRCITDSTVVIAFSPIFIIIFNYDFLKDLALTTTLDYIFLLFAMSPTYLGRPILHLLLLLTIEVFQINPV